MDESPTKAKILYTANAVLIPLQVATVWGIVGAVVGWGVGLVGATIANYFFICGIRWGVVFAFAIVGFLVGFVMSWVAEMDLRHRSITALLIGIVGDALQRDIDRNDDIGNHQAEQSEPRSVRHEFEIKSNDGRTVNFFNLDWDEDKYDLIIDFAIRSLKGVQFSEPVYLKAKKKLLTPSQFHSLRNQFVENGWLVKKSGNQGFMFTDKGYLVLEQIAQEGDGDVVEGEAVEI